MVPEIEDFTATDKPPGPVPDPLGPRRPRSPPWYWSRASPTPAVARTTGGRWRRHHPDNSPENAALRSGVRAKSRLVLPAAAEHPFSLRENDLPPGASTAVTGPCPSGDAD